MKRILSFIALACMALSMSAKGAAIQLDFSGTSMTIELSQQPKIVTEDGKVVLKTNSLSITFTLPCKITPIGVSDSENAIEDVIIRNNNEKTPIDVYSLDGKKVGSLKDKNEVLSLKRGIYVINGKKVLIK